MKQYCTCWNVRPFSYFFVSVDLLVVSSLQQLILFCSLNIIVTLLETLIKTRTVLEDSLRVGSRMDYPWWPKTTDVVIITYPGTLFHRQVIVKTVSLDWTVARRIDRWVQIDENTAPYLARGSKWNHCVISSRLVVYYRKILRATVCDLPRQGFKQEGLLEQPDHMQYWMKPELLDRIGFLTFVKHVEPAGSQKI